MTAHTLTIQVVDAPDNLLEELLADPPPALLCALVHGVLHQVVSHVIVAAVDQPHHQVRGHAAERLSLRVGQGQQLSDVLLAPRSSRTSAPGSRRHQSPILGTDTLTSLSPALA